MILAVLIIILSVHASFSFFWCSINGPKMCPVVVVGKDVDSNQSTIIDYM
jgi:hypothetical protein